MTRQHGAGPGEAHAAAGQPQQALRGQRGRHFTRAGADAASAAAAAAAAVATVGAAIAAAAIGAAAAAVVVVVVVVAAAVAATGVAAAISTARASRPFKCEQGPVKKVKSIS